MTSALSVPVSAPASGGIPAVPWRDPYTLSPERLSECIQALETACRDQPQSADLRTCLGMAYAMNYDVYQSMDALEAAVALQPDHFFARFKYAELHYRLRALVRAELETLHALELARSPWELSLARAQLRAIRQRRREGTQQPEWTRPLTAPAMLLLALIIVCVAVYCR